MKTIRTEISFTQLIILSAAFLATSCGSDAGAANSGSAQPKNSTKTATGAQTSGVSPSPSPTGSDGKNQSDGQFFAVIREFGRKDTGALFEIPEEATQVTKVVGPSFLGQPLVGQLNAQSVQHIFTNSSIPMSEEERNDLLSAHDGAEVMYFQGYDGQLCSDSEFQITISSTVGGLGYTTILDISAKRNSQGDCVFDKLFQCFGPTGQTFCTFPGN